MSPTNGTSFLAPDAIAPHPSFAHPDHRREHPALAGKQIDWGKPWSVAMKCWLPLAFVLTISILTAPHARAYVEDPYITPSQSTPHDRISVHVNAGWCHAPAAQVDEGVLNLVSPGRLELIVEGVVLPQGHPFCIYPPYTYRFDIGTLPAGDYTLQFFMHDDLVGSGLVGFGSAAFSVRAPYTIPASSLPDIALLAVSVASLGALTVRRHSALL